MRPSEGVLRLWREVDPKVNPTVLGAFSGEAWEYLDPLIEVDLSQGQVDSLTSLTIDVLGYNLHSIAQLEDEIIKPMNDGFWIVTSESFLGFCLRNGMIDRYMRHRRRLESNLFRFG